MQTFKVQFSLVFYRSIWLFLKQIVRFVLILLNCKMGEYTFAICHINYLLVMNGGGKHFAFALASAHCEPALFAVQFALTVWTSPGL